MSTLLGTLALLAPLIQFGVREDVDPSTIASSSGEWTVDIDPSDRMGHGSADYTMRRAGEVLWQNQLPVTLVDAVLTNAGVLAGYGYADGAARNARTFDVLLVDPEGKVRAHHATPLEMSRYLHTPSNPCGLATMLDEERDRFVVRVADPDVNRGSQVWWIYRLSDGERVGEFTPEQHVAQEDTTLHLVDARPIPGLPLTLLHYRAYDFSDFSMGYFREGALFSIIDEEGDPVWTHALPHDYTIENDEIADNALERFVLETGVIRGTRNAGFTLWFVEDAADVDFTVELVGASDWKVREVERMPVDRSPSSDSATTATGPAEEIPTIELRALGSVKLGGRPANSGPIRDIVEFAFDPGGALRFVRREDDGTFTEVWVRPEGDVLREIPIPPLAPAIEGNGTWRLAPDGSWLHFVNNWGDEFMHVWRVDPGAGRSEHVARVSCPACNPFLGDIAVSPDGGFVTLGYHTEDINSGPSLRRFGPGGELLWEKAPGYNGGDVKDLTHLFSPESIAVLDDGRIALLSNIRNLIQVWWPDGQFSHAFDLEEAMGQEPNYASELWWDTDAGLLLEDFNGTPAYWRFGLDGSLRSSFDASHLDGRELGRGLCAAPDGTIWATDGQLLYALDDSGVVVRSIGESPDIDELHEPGAVAVDRRGRIHIHDGRTGAIHVFESSGAKVLVCRALPEDVGAVSSISDYAFGPEGDVYLGAGWNGDRYLHFDEHGKRMGLTQLGASNVSFCPGSDRYWGVDEGLVLRSTSGEEITRVTRRPGDRRWLRVGGPPAIAPDGRVLVFSDGLALFSADGEPLELFPLPDGVGGKLAFTGRWATLSHWSAAALLIDLENDSLFRFEMPDAPEDASCHTTFSPDGRELWMIDGTNRTLHRFALPH